MEQRSVGVALTEACCLAGHSVQTEGQGYDVDEVEDFVQLIASLAQDRRPARRALLELAKRIVSSKIVDNA